MSRSKHDISDIVVFFALVAVILNGLNIKSLKDRIEVLEKQCAKAVE